MSTTARATVAPSDPGSLPLVTVAVPVFNGAAFLDRAIGALVRQTYPAIEILVVDNGSTDATSEIASRWAAEDARVTHLRFDSTIPMIPNFRRALALARGTYFTWNSADDWRHPEMIADSVAVLEQHPQATMVDGPVTVEDVKAGRDFVVDAHLDLMAQDVATRITTFTGGMQHAAMLYGLYRREALTRIFFPAHSGQDYLVCLQACALGPIARTRRPIITYRHVWGEVDTPMYKVERPTLRDLLVYRGVRRRKCWVTLLTGAWYVLRLEGLPRATRVRGALAHVREFVRRYRRALVTEWAFMLAEPAAWVCRPFVPAGRRLKHRFKRRLPSVAS